jgi:hypothetical protein
VLPAEQVLSGEFVFGYVFLFQIEAFKGGVVFALVGIVLFFKSVDRIL